MSLWGKIDIAARAPQLAAPALAVDDKTGWRLLVWTGVTEGEARLFARHAASGEVKILTLKAFFPYNLHLYPAADAQFHLLWLDKWPNDRTIHLLAALVNAEATAAVDVHPLSEGAAYHYAAAPEMDGGLRVVWSSGLLSEPALYMRLIDGRGRLRFPAKLTDNADYPALVQATDGLYLFWLADRQRVMRGKLVNETLTDVQPLFDSPALNPGDRLEAFAVVMDMTHGYLFWQIVRAEGSPEVWLATWELATNHWTAPAQLMIPPHAPGSVATGFNSGAVNITLPLTDTPPTPVQWAMPLTGQNPSVPVVVNTGELLGVAYLRWGSVAGYQTLAQTGPLFGAPFITTDRSNHLYVVWSQPGADMLANELRMTGTR